MWGGIGALIGIVIIIVLTLYLSLYSGTIDIHIMLYGNPIILFINSVLASVCILFLGKLIVMVNFGRRLFLWLANNSLLVMVTHEYLKIKDLIAFVVGKIMDISTDQYTIVEFFILMIVEYILCKLLSGTNENILNRILAMLLKIESKQRTFLK